MDLSKKSHPKHSRSEELFFEPEDIRWATPEIVAKYRAERLKCNIIIDLGCGIGFQTFAFAQTCQKVYAIEIDKRKIENAQKNAEVLGLKNIEFIHGDMLDPAIIKKVKKADIVFCDPERLPEEERRSVGSIIPGVDKILAAYGKITSKIAIEFPPQIKEILFDCEKEYLSLDGALNRLTLYFHGLKEAERSAIILSKVSKEEKIVSERIVNNPKAKLIEHENKEKPNTYLYEVDSAVVKADLLAELGVKTGCFLFSRGKATFFTSDKRIKNTFFKKMLEVVATVPFNEKDILTSLQKNECGKVVIRYSVDPQDYWKERKNYESKLKGNKMAYLFQFGLKAVIGEEI
ncbi:class I SAM-dependent methyltransferase [Candidatus Woesearchaeota archaeon]|nr:class I SAM-dependent methyltransferase [Candidatus Woesearchaeota archaeon]